MPMAIRFHQTGGAISDQTLSAEARAELIARSESLYQKADEVEPDKRYIYSSRPTIREANTARLGAWLSLLSKSEKEVPYKPTEIEAERHPEDPNNGAAIGRLDSKWGQCMHASERL